MALPFFAREISAATPASTGTQTYSSPGIGTPVAAIVIATHGTTAGTKSSECATSWGITDGDEQRVGFAYSKNNVTTTVAKHGGSSSAIIKIVHPDDGSVHAEGSFVQWVTDGIEINWTSVPATPILFGIALLTGDELEAAVLDCQSSAGAPTDFVTTNPVTSATFQPDALLAHFYESDTTTAQFRFGGGISVRTPSVANCSAFAFSMDALPTGTRTRRVKSSSFLAATYSGATPTTLVNDVFVSAYNSDGFEIDGTNAVATPRIAVLALKFGSVGFALDTVEPTPGATGVEGKTFPGHKTGFLYALFNASSSETNQAGGAAGIGFTDFLTARCASAGDENNQLTSNNHSVTSDLVLDQWNDAGTTHLYAADYESIDATGFSLDWSIVNATARAWAALSIELSPIPADAAGTLPALQGSGASNQRLIATGAGALSALVGSGAAALRLAATAAGTLPALQAAGTSALRLVASAAATLPKLAASGVATLRIAAAAAGTLPALVGEGAANVIAEEQDSTVVVEAALSIETTVGLTLRAAEALEFDLATASTIEVALGMQTTIEQELST